MGIIHRNTVQLFHTRNQEKERISSSLFRAWDSTRLFSLILLSATRRILQCIRSRYPATEKHPHHRCPTALTQVMDCSTGTTVLSKELKNSFKKRTFESRS